MTFRDLQETVARLAGDPRVHASTPLGITYRLWDDEAQTWESETKPLCHVVLDPAGLRFSTEPDEPAVAR